MNGLSSASNHAPILSGHEGELVSVRINVEPRALEETLDALAHVGFPINPEIFHGWPTVIEFPAYRSRLSELKTVLARYGFPATGIHVTRMLDAILTC